MVLVYVVCDCFGFCFGLVAFVWGGSLDWCLVGGVVLLLLIVLVN